MSKHLSSQTTVNTEVISVHLKLISEKGIYISDEVQFCISLMTNCFCNGELIKKNKLISELYDLNQTEAHMD